jgi:signal transduction histidine kinase
MPVTLNEKLIAYLTLFSGLAISLVAEFYSIIGFTAIFAAAQIPVIIMGIVLGIGKIAATLWLKQNWKIAHWLVRTYLLTAIAVLMGVTSMGIFGFLSKAHSDQSLVSGDVQSKIAIYDEKIKTARENIDANRKALKQMDEAVDQVMARSSSETGADKAVGLRRSQQKERVRLQSEIQAEQKTIASLNEERAPIAADVRKVEAEVGPIKYIAQFVYGESDKDLLEKAVTWVIIILIAVFDPLAVILLLASQISFQNFRDRRTLTEPFELGPNEYIPDPEEEAFYKKSNTVGDSPRGTTEVVDPKPPTVTTSTGFIAQEIADIFPEAVTGVEETVAISVDEINELLAQARQELEEQRQREIEDELERNRLVKVAKTYIPEKSILEQHPYLLQPSSHFKNLQPMVYKPELERMNDRSAVAPESEFQDLERPGDYLDEPLFVQNEEQLDSGLWTKTAKAISQEEYTEVSRQEVVINEWIRKINNKEITMADVPEHLLLDIRARR